MSTICAISTAYGTGGIAVIRVSGEQAVPIADSLFSGRTSLRDAKPGTVHFGRIERAKEVLDEVLCSVFRAPHSFTGEDTVEIACHGSLYIQQELLRWLIDAGCRAAEPGEFTRRAFLNGKMDLSQAEAVADLIASTNKATHQIAMSQLRGHFSSELSSLREQLLRLTSLLELELDFSDHEDLEFADRNELLEIAQRIDSHISHLVQTFETGQALKNGIPVAIIGKTNVGKSTLLNKLLKDERAIVSDIHGTTRDTIEDTIDIQGITFRFIDTAGIRQTADTVEKIGIERTYQAMEKARIILWLIDEEPSKEELQVMQEKCEGKSLIIIQNKIDKEEKIPTSTLSSLTTHFVTISAKFGTNIDQLEKEIYTVANIPEIKENDIIVTNARHYNALLRAQEDIQRVISGLEQNLSGDLLSEDLRMILSTLAEITGGEITPNEVLGNIFKHFCVGK